MDEEHKIVEDVDTGGKVMGTARPCPLPVDEDPDMQDYSNTGDVLVLEVGNAK